MGQICVWCLTSKLLTDQFMASTHCGLEICVQIASGNGLFSDGTKPFSEPMLTCKLKILIPKCMIYTFEFTAKPHRHQWVIVCVLRKSICNNGWSVFPNSDEQIQRYIACASAIPIYAWHWRTFSQRCQMQFILWTYVYAWMNIERLKVTLLISSMHLYFQTNLVICDNPNC